MDNRLFDKLWFNCWHLSLELNQGNITFPSIVNSLLGQGLNVSPTTNWGWCNGLSSQCVHNLCRHLHKDTRTFLRPLLQDNPPLPCTRSVVVAGVTWVRRGGGEASWIGTQCSFFLLYSCQGALCGCRDSVCKNERMYRMVGLSGQEQWKGWGWDTIQSNSVPRSLC